MSGRMHKAIYRNKKAVSKIVMSLCTVGMPVNHWEASGLLGCPNGLLIANICLKVS